MQLRALHRGKKQRGFQQEETLPRHETILLAMKDVNSRVNFLQSLTHQLLCRGALAGNRDGQDVGEGIEGHFHSEGALWQMAGRK